MALGITVVTIFGDDGTMDSSLTTEARLCEMFHANGRLLWFTDGIMMIWSYKYSGQTRGY